MGLMLLIGEHVGHGVAGVSKCGVRPTASGQPVRSHRQIALHDPGAIYGRRRQGSRGTPQRRRRDPQIVRRPGVVTCARSPAGQRRAGRRRDGRPRVRLLRAGPSAAHAPALLDPGDRQDERRRRRRPRELARAERGGAEDRLHEGREDEQRLQRRARRRCRRRPTGCSSGRARGWDGSASGRRADRAPAAAPRR